MQKMFWIHRIVPLCHMWIYYRKQHFNFQMFIMPFIFQVIIFTIYNIFSYFVTNFSNGRYVTESVSDNICLECDVGCFRCAKYDNATTTCKIGTETFCQNGYRVSNNTGSNARVQCTKCENQDSTRCRT